MTDYEMIFGVMQKALKDGFSIYNALTRKFTHEFIMSAFIDKWEKEQEQQRLKTLENVEKERQISIFGVELNEEQQIEFGKWCMANQWKVTEDQMREWFSTITKEETP